MSVKTVLDDEGHFSLSRLSNLVSSTPTVQQEVNLVATTEAALQADFILIRAALLWLSHHPQLTPLFLTIGKYAANHTLTSCFSQGTCRNCQKCLHFLGLDIDHVGMMDLCESALMSAYAEAIHHPFYSMELATKGINLIKNAVSELASMPETASNYHAELAKYLYPIITKTVANSSDKTDDNSNNNNRSMLLVRNTLKKGQEIYKKAQASAWLYVGLPEIIAKFKGASVVMDELGLQNIINEVYTKWRLWGRQNSDQIKFDTCNIGSSGGDNVPAARPSSTLSITSTNTFPK